MRHCFSALLFYGIGTSICLGAEVLAPIYVTGENAALSQTGDVEHSEFTGTHDYISSEQLDKEDSSLAKVISHQAGVQFRQAGGAGSFSNISVRAATSAQTNIYFDGVLLNSASSGGLDLSQLELLNLEGIHVYRGATPVQLGAGSIGGAVNLLSRANRGNSAGILLGLGSFNEQKLQLSYQNKGETIDTIFAFSQHRADNDFEFDNENGTPLNVKDDARERRNNAQFSRSAFLLKLGQQGNETIRYDAVLQYTDREQGIPHWRNLKDTKTSYDTTSFQLQLNRRRTEVEDGLWSNLHGFYVNRNTEAYDDSLDQIGLGTQSSEDESVVVGARSYWELIRDTGTISFNSDVRTEKLEHDDVLGMADYGATRQGLSGVAQFSLFRFAERLLLTPAIRIQGLMDDYDGVLRSGSDSRRNFEFTPQFGLKWSHSSNIELTANIGKHHREPTFFELFGDRGLFIGNDRLVAEKGINADLGISWKADSPDGKGTGRAVSFTAFISDRDQLIVSVFDARGIGRSENSGKARVTGVEGKIDWVWARRWQANINLTWQSAENRSTNAASSGKQLPGEAAVATFGRLMYQQGSWSAWYDAEIILDRYFDSANLLASDDQYIHNVGFAYSTRGFSARLLLQNLSNDNAQDFNGYSKPGRSLNFNITYSFEGAKA